MAGQLTIDTLKASSGVLATQNGMTGIAKAWVTFNGNNGTTYATFNISSVTRNSTANYTLNFTTALANSNYAWSGSAISAANQAIFVGGPVNTALGSGRSTTSLTLAGFYQNAASNGDTDNAYYSIIVCGN